MIFNDIYKYNVNDFLKIETDSYIYSAYVKSKTNDSIDIRYLHPKELSEYYYNYDEIKLLVSFEEIISIQLINMDIFKIGKYYEINKRVLLKDGPVEYIDKYSEIPLKMVAIGRNIYTSYPLELVKQNDTYKIAFSPIEIILLAKDMYKPKIKINEVFNFNNFNKLSEKIDVEEETEKFKEYFEQIKDGNFYTINDELWDIIKDNNYDEKYDCYEEDEWEYRKLKISDSDEFGLIIYDENIIDKFEEFTKILKAKHKHTLAFVDNENGIIYILKTKKK